MIRSIQIRNYRGFADFEMNHLGRVNLLVGKNNSGKTSALEALYLLASKCSPASLWSVLWRRGERMLDRNPESYPQIAICHLFHGHEAPPGSKFVLSAQNDIPSRHLTVSIGEINEDQRKKEITKNGIPLPLRLGLHIKGNPSPPVETIPLSRAGGMSSDSLESGRRIRRLEAADDESPTKFINTESASGDDLITLWDSVALTPHEDRVYAALRLLEPKIERIASRASRQYFGGTDRGGFMVKMNGADQPVPIGSMGDGVWRIMAMAISLAQCANGVLLIDEIDTGLHYSVMTDMWKLIYGTATELNVQVFATTHSNDCVRSLAELCFEDTKAAKDVTLQRIEQGKKRSIPYSAKEIEIAAEKQIEVR